MLLSAATRGLVRRPLLHRHAGLASRATPPPPPPHDAAPAGSSASSSSDDGKPKPPIPDSTMLFRMTNPEVAMDPNKRISWVITGVVGFLLLARWGYAFYWDVREDRLGPQAPEPEADTLQVSKRLPDGRLLMTDGSIRKPP